MKVLSARIRVLRVLHVATIRGWRLFRLEFPIVRLLFEGGDYSRAASNQRNTVAPIRLIQDFWLISYIYT